MILRLLELEKEEINTQETGLAREYIKLGAAIVVALCASLRGPEVSLLDLAGLWEYIEVGRQGSILGNPLKVGVSLATAPHVVIILLGKFKFKGEKSGAHRHQVALASTTQSGIEVRLWMEQLLEVRQQEG